MPPKTKAGGKSKGKALGVVIDGVNISEMTREQLEVFTIRLKDELEREREERNYFQIERDKLRTFWEITRSELNEIKARLKNTEGEMEEASEKNSEQIKIFRQKIKHLQYEHESAISELKAESMMTLKETQDNFVKEENELLRDKRELKHKLYQQQIDCIEQIQAIKLQQGETISNTHQRFYELCEHTEKTYAHMFDNLQNELKTKYAMEVKEVEERNNNKVQCLIENHSKALANIKNYYNDITLNNLALITTLKEQLVALKNQNERLTKQINEVTSDNKKLVEPLMSTQTEIEQLKRKLLNYEKDKAALTNTKMLLHDTRKKYEDLRWTNDALELRFEKLQAANEQLRSKFMECVLEVQQQTELKNMMLQERITALEEQVDNKETSMDEISSTGIVNLEPEVITKCKLTTILI